MKNKDRDDYILNHYTEETVKEMSQKLGCSVSSCYSVLRRNGLYGKFKTEADKRCSMSRSQREELIKANYKRCTIKELQDLTGLTHSGIITNLKRLNISISDLNYNRVVNEFIIEDSNWFYFVGLMLADGSISRDNKIDLRLSIKDEDVIKEIAKWIEYRTHIRYCDEFGRDFKIKRISKNGINEEPIMHSGPRCGLDFKSKYISDRLNYYGVEPRKTGKEDYKNIPDEYYKDFIRGFIDGDGCVYKGYISILCNSELCKKFRVDLSRLYGIETKVSSCTCSDKVVTLRLNIKESEILGKEMYKGPHIGLKRKEDKFKDYHTRVRGVVFDD